MDSFGGVAPVPAPFGDSGLDRFQHALGHRSIGEVSPAPRHLADRTAIRIAEPDPREIVRIGEERCGGVLLSMSPNDRATVLAQCRCVVCQALDLDSRSSNRGPGDGDEVVEQIGPLRNVDAPSDGKLGVVVLQRCDPRALQFGEHDPAVWGAV